MPNVRGPRENQKASCRETLEKFHMPTENRGQGISHKKAQKVQESFCGFCAFLWLVPCPCFSPE